ncbi:hypothetical protein [Caldalkalibacillus mannanilyticus]|uniref:hypothetical protein n=1 Tax=Caldalkalibacillus mannanilyticus TaxID=1418 RepID=UPI0006857FF9|nr:hypothetical protein [Caldalkalibacillus mannanilyticus]
MNGLLQWLEALIHAIPSFFLSPFPYVMLGIIALQWQRQIDLERKLFSARLHTVAEGILHSVFYGLLGGLLVSILILGSGVVFSTVPLLYLWGIAFVLMLFHVRYLCFAYSGAILGGAVLVARWFPQGADIVWLSEVWGQLNSISLPSLFAFVALLHLIEALLIFLAGSKRGTPIYLEGKRGKLVGGYQLQHFWLVPVFVLVEGGQATLPVLYQGWPFFTTSSTAVYSLLLVPAVLVFSEQVTSSRPEQKAKFMAQGLAAYSLLLLGMAVATQYAPSLVY